MATFRRIPIVKGQIYHVFNRSVGRQPIFTYNSSYQRALQTIAWYQYLETPLRYSHFLGYLKSLKVQRLMHYYKARKELKLLLSV
jgi:hypothetical protein